jgi:hypothetical protein
LPRRPAPREDAGKQEQGAGEADPSPDSPELEAPVHCVATLNLQVPGLLGNDPTWEDLMQEIHDPAGHGEPPIDFTIDGEPFESADRDPLAGFMLANFAKVDPANYDLGELRGQNPAPHIFADGDVVHLHPGARYVSVRTGPGPVE